MRNKLRGFFSDVAAYGQVWFHLVRHWALKSFAAFEGVKDAIVGILYRQRGRFAQPFVHTGMMGISAAGIMLAPVLASSGRQIFASTTPTPMPLVLSASTQAEPDSTTISDKPRDSIVQYTVQSGDTFSSIAQKFGISVDTILWQNNLTESDLLKPGQSLDILPVTGIAYTVGRGDTVYTIAKKFKANAQAIVDFPFNTFANDETFDLTVGQTLIVPDGVEPQAPAILQPLLPIAQFSPSVGTTAGSGQFGWPVAGVISQRYSWYHRAIDIANPNYPPVYASDGGTVIAAGWDTTGYGNKVMIDHHNGYETLYGHMSKIIVSVGQNVSKGQQIGIEGSTGRSTGPHVHFEIRYHGVLENPLLYLR